MFFDLHASRVRVAYANATSSHQGVSGELSVRHWVHTHYGYANFLEAIVVAICSRLVFFRAKFNVFETWILIAYCMATAMLMLIPFCPCKPTFLS